MSVRITRRPWSVPALLLLVAVGACDADPIGSDGHPAPVEVRLATAGVYFANATEFQAFGSLLATEGEAPEVVVEFYNADGSFFAVSGDQYLEVVLDDGTVARWEVENEGDFTGNLRGLAVGTTRIRFRLMHGTVGSSAAHSDFTSAKIEVNIVP